MKKLIAFVTVVCLMLSSFCGLAAAEQDTPRWNGFRGLDWGASAEEVIAVTLEMEENADHYGGEGRKDNVDYSFINFTPVSMSKFAPEQVYLAYILADDHLFLAGYAIHGSQDPEADWDYLRKTLSSIYGYPSESAKKPLPPTIEEIGFDGSWCEHFTFWEVDGTVIYAGVYQGSAAIFYYGYEYYTNLMDQPHNSEDEINTYGL